MQDIHSPSANSTPEQAPKVKWYHFRWKILLIAVLLLLIPAAYLAWRQTQQVEAIADLKSRKAILRTEPIALPFVEQLVGTDHSQQIIEVYWVAGDVSEEDLAALANVKTLRKLELTNSKVDGSGFRHLVGLNDLYMLHCSGTKIGDEALEHVAKLKALEVLSLNGTQVTDEGLENLADLPRLERLFLNDTAITDKGLDSIAEMTQLKELGLKDLPITDAGLAKLKTLVNLEVLGLDNNPHLTREGILELRKTIPRLVFSLDEESQSNPATQTRKNQDSKPTEKPSA